MISVVKTEPADPGDWYAHVLQQALEQYRPLRALVLSGQPDELAAAGPEWTVSVRTGNGAQARWNRLQCRTGGLPFQDGAFELVVLHHWVDQNDERDLAAVRQALVGGGQLLVLGRGRFSLGRCRRKTRAGRAWRPGWLCRRLQRMGFQTRDLRGRGLAGLDVTTGQGWRRSLLACSDRVAVRARRSDGRTDIRLVRFSRPKGSVASGTAWDGARRERAS